MSTDMPESIIQVENLGKKYIISHQNNERYIALRDIITEKVKGLTRKLFNSGYLQQNPDSKKEDFWALKDVSFNIKQGEVVGIIGSNGAGKSTLLKMLSRITEPTTGKIRIKGRVASLLEVGTGFHPELTGRENIFLNGAILGMTRSEIKSKFDEIVEFAEIEKFLDTPVKRYSSGMYVRLAFAVAAHLESEILLIDEVLAVGDANFQKKCLNKMENISEKGRTVLLVSHNMGAISRICPRSLVLRGGKIVKDDISSESISNYLEEMINTNNYYFSQDIDKNLPLGLTEIKAYSESGNTCNYFSRNKPITIQIQYQVNTEVHSVHIYAKIINAEGTIVFATGDADMDKDRFGLRKPGVYDCYFNIPPNILNEGDYYLSLSIGVPHQIVYQKKDQILSFRVIDIVNNNRVIHQNRIGTIWLDIKWNYIGESPFC